MDVFLDAVRLHAFITISFCEPACPRNTRDNSFLQALSQWGTRSDGGLSGRYVIHRPAHGTDVAHAIRFHDRNEVAEACTHALKRVRARMMRWPALSIADFFPWPFFGALTPHWEFWRQWLGRHTEPFPHDAYLHAARADIRCVLPTRQYICQLSSIPRVFTFETVRFECTEGRSGGCPRCKITAAGPLDATAPPPPLCDTATILMTVYLYVRAIASMNYAPLQNSPARMRTLTELIVALISGMIPVNVVEHIRRGAWVDLEGWNLLRNGAISMRTALLRQTVPAGNEIAGLLHFIHHHHAAHIPTAQPIRPVRVVNAVALPAPTVHTLPDTLNAMDLPFVAEHVRWFLESTPNVVGLYFVAPTTGNAVSTRDVAQFVRAAQWKSDDYVLVGASTTNHAPAILVTTPLALYRARCHALAWQNSGGWSADCATLLAATPCPGQTSDKFHHRLWTDVRYVAFTQLDVRLTQTPGGAPSPDPLAPTLLIPLLSRLRPPQDFQTIAGVAEAVLRLHEPHQMTAGAFELTSRVLGAAPEYAAAYPALVAYWAGGNTPAHRHITQLIPRDVLREVLQLALTPLFDDNDAALLVCGIAPTPRRMFTQSAPWNPEGYAPLSPTVAWLDVPPGCEVRADALGGHECLCQLIDCLPLPEGAPPLIPLGPGDTIFPDATPPNAFPWIIGQPFDVLCAEFGAGIPLEIRQTRSDHSKHLVDVLKHSENRLQRHASTAMLGGGAADPPPAGDGLLGISAHRLRREVTDLRIDEYGTHEHLPTPPADPG